MIVDQMAKRYSRLPHEVAQVSGENWQFNLATFAWGLELDRIITEKIEQERKRG
jgi:hypothetical protein